MLLILFVQASWENSELKYLYLFPPPFPHLDVFLVIVATDASNSRTELKAVNAGPGEGHGLTHAPAIVVSWWLLHS